MRWAEPLSARARVIRPSHGRKMGLSYLSPDLPNNEKGHRHQVTLSSASNPPNGDWTPLRLYWLVNKSASATFL